MDDFIQITLFCPPDPRVGAFRLQECEKSLWYKNIFISFYRRSKLWQIIHIMTEMDIVLKYVMMMMMMIIIK